MNDGFREIKDRVRKLEELLTGLGGTARIEHVDLAQELSRAHRLIKHGDRSRDPSPEIRAAVERAENLARSMHA